MANYIKTALNRALSVVLPSRRLPKAANVDNIVRPLGRMLTKLREAEAQHNARAKAQTAEASRLLAASVASSSQADRAGRLAEKLYAFVG